jgi:hypothetical protein
MAEQLTETIETVQQKIDEGSIPDCLALRAKALLQAGTPTPAHSTS